MNLLQDTIKEINQYTNSWKWKMTDDELYLGHCFKYKFYTHCYLLKDNFKSEDIIKSWKEENLIIECKSALFILTRWIIYKKFGKDYCDKNLEMFDYTTRDSDRNFYNMLPFDSSYNQTDILSKKTIFF